VPGYRISAGAIVEHEGRLLMVRHVRPGRYDFWVAPGGGVEGDERLEEAAAREVREETGLEVEVGRLLYIEDLVSPDCRYVKFWFAAQLLGGAFDLSHPQARAEHVADAAWLSPQDLAGKPVFPELLSDRYAADRAAGFPGIVRLPLRRMEFW
jgi:8-oxo-dGTP diphosphatase